MCTELSPSQSPYEVCISALTSELEHLKILLANLQKEDDKLKQNHKTAENIALDPRVDLPALELSRQTTPASFDTKCTSAINSRLRYLHDDSLSPMLGQVEITCNVLATEADVLSPQAADGAVAVEHSVQLSGKAAKDRLPGDGNFTVESMQSTRTNISQRISARECDEQKERHASERSNSAGLSLRSEQAFTTCRNKAQKFVTSSVFELFFAVAIFTNSLLIGIEVDWNARNRGEEGSIFFLAADFVYTAIFLIELVLRIYCSGCSFFKSSPNVVWNYFDLTIVTASLYEAGLTIVLLTFGQVRGGLTGVSPMRAARLLRIARLMRFMRVARITRFVDALRAMVVSIIGTLRSLFWAMVLLTLFIYAFAIVFAQAATDTVLLDDGHLEIQDKETLLHYWGDLLRAMLTLFASLTSGVSWEIPAWSLARIGPLMLGLYLLFLVFTYFAVLNVLVAVFVQNASDTAQRDQHMIVQNKIGQKKAYIQLARQLFRKVDGNESGQINYKELQSVFHDDEVQGYLESLEIRVDDAWSLFKHLDTDEGQSIDLAEFVSGCLRLRGGARGIDLANMRFEHQHLESQLHDFMSMTEGKFSNISIQLTQMTAGKQNSTSTPL